ncbi:MAG: hypothetical protein U1D30_10100 [Planctomycetota bacterium]
MHFETLKDIAKDVERLMTSPRIVQAGNWIKPPRISITWPSSWRNRSPA